MMRTFTTSELIAHVRDVDGERLTRGVLQYYVQHAYVRPRSVSDAPPRPATRGRPSDLMYTTEDVVLIRWMLRLRHDGVKLSRFKLAIQELRRRLPAALKTPERIQLFVIDRARHVATSMNGRAIQLTGCKGQVLLTFPTDLAVETLKQATGH